MNRDQDLDFNADEPEFEIDEDAAVAAIVVATEETRNPPEDDRNPKDIVGSTKVPMSYLPAAGEIWGAIGCADGAEKYGPYNWREKDISYMEYISAMERHLKLLKAGQDLASDSKCHHLGHVIATASILLDAELHGSLIDDRPLMGVPAEQAEEEILERFRVAKTEAQRRKAELDALERAYGAADD